MFWPIVTGSCGVSAATFAVVFGYWRFWPNRRHEKRVLDLKALRDLLLYHVDDLEDIMAALKARHDADLRASAPVLLSLSCLSSDHLTVMLGIGRGCTRNLQYALHSMHGQAALKGACK